MDQNGAIVQARLGDAMPLASMQRLVVEDRDGSRSVMVDMQGREIARFNKTYSVDASTASEGVVVYEGDNGRHGFVNAEGKRVVGPYFNKLGPLRDGLARARREQRSGKLYGYIDLTGRYAIAPAFAWADDFREGRALARRGDQLMYIDPRGQAAASFSLVCGAVVIRDAQQRVTWPASRSPAPTPPACNTRRPPKPPSRTVMTLRLIPLTRLACAVAVLGLPLAAQAQQYWHASCAYDAPSPLATGGFYDGESDAVSGCIRSISEGRAAVLLPSALRSIKRVPTDTSLRGHAWGFLDGQGRLAVKPIFDQVGDFHHGLAAVQWQGKWGYIDARGRMAIAPRFDEVSDFVEAGLAIVTLDGKRQIIDRQGKPTGDALDASVDNAQLSDGLPARLIVRYRPEYQAPDGTRRYDEPGRRITGAYGKDLLIAATERGEYGLLNDKWEWVVEPRYEEITVQSDWTLAVAQGREEVVLLDAKGEAIGAGKGYRSLAPMGAFWLAELRRGSYELLDAKGQRLGNIDERQSRRIEPIGKALLSMSGDTAKLWVPGRTEAVTLGKDLATPRQTQGYALFLSEARRPLGLLTPGGGWVDGAALPATVGQIDGFDEVHGRLWLHDADGKLLAVFNPDGKPALDAAALAALSEQPMRALRHAGPDAPLAC